jgi:hypothetical protein
MLNVGLFTDITSFWHQFCVYKIYRQKESSMFTTLPLLFTALFPQTASALSCLEGVTHVVPADGSMNLPTNTLPVVWTAYNSLVQDDVQLVDVVSGESIDFTVTEQHGAYLIETEDGFNADTQYQLYGNVDEYEITVFTTGTSMDEDAPEQPVILNSSRDKDRDMWGSWDHLDLELDASEDTSYFLVEVAENSDFSDSTLILTTAWDNSSISIGSGLCGGNYSREDVKNIEYVRVTAYDIAGNPSEESDVLQVRSFGCSTIAASNIGLWGIIGFLGLAVRRRR